VPETEEATQLSRPSKKQRELLSFIDAFIKGHGYGPSYREIMRSLGLKSVSTVAIHIDNLINKGHLRKRTRSARSLEVVAKESTYRPAPAPVTKTQQKWLIDQVAKRFDDFQKEPNVKELDNLYVLVGALKVLGLEEAATSFKSRLKEFKDSLEEQITEQPKRSPQ
jgi:repressor LexA